MSVNYEYEYPRTLTDMKIWEDVAMKAHLKIIKLRRELEQTREKHAKEIIELKNQIESQNI